MDSSATRNAGRTARFRRPRDARPTRLSLERLEDRRLLAVVGPTLDLANLGSLGFAIDGATASGFAGYSVGPAGDVNGDGLADVIVGAHNATVAGRTQSGETYVVFGAASGIPANVDAAALNGANGFRIRGAEAFDRSGFSVRTAGDVNGDGVDDLIVGSFDLQATAGLDQVGQAHVVFGRVTPFPSVIDLATMGASVGFQIRGQSAFDNAGRAVSAAGDVNGDGIGDLLVGAPEASPNGRIRSGQVYVVFGRTTGFGSLVIPSSLNGSNGFVINGAATGDYAGISVSSAGDVNGDGFDDILVGAERADPGGRTQAGTAYVIFGKGTPFAAQLDLNALDGANGFALSGAAEDDFAGRSVGRAGDVNGDGFDDVIVGAPEHRLPEALRIGRAHVVFGHGGSFPAEIPLASLDGSNGFTLVGIDPADRAGRSVDGAGDVNGDGFDDLIVGALRGDPLGRTDAGEAYLVFGKPGGFAAEQSLAALNGLNGLTIQGAAANDLAGLSVAGAGDVNGDGFDDVVIGAYYADPPGRTNAGRGYVIFGGQFNELALSVANIAAAPEGEASAFDVLFQNYGRPHTLSIDWGDGHVEQIALDAATSSIRPTHVYADNGSYAVMLTLVDQQSPERVATGATTIAVANVAPLFGPIGAPQTAEGALFSLSGIVAFADSGFDNPTRPGGATSETFSYQVNWGDGTAIDSNEATVTVAGSPGVATQGTVPATHRYADNGIYTISVTVTDDDGGSESIAFQVIVTNLPPAIILNAPSVAPEGSRVTISATVLDAGFDNPNGPNGPTRETFTYLVDWGDGTSLSVRPVETIAPGGPGQPTTAYFEASHYYADGGSYGLVVVVTDDDGGSSAQFRNLGVTNVAPQVTVVGNQAAQQGVELAIVDIATFFDPGFSSTNIVPPRFETFTYTIDWGDGSPLATGFPTIDVPGEPGIPTQGSLDGAHTYSTTGTFNVAVTVRDDDGGAQTKSFQVQVVGVSPNLNLDADLNAQWLRQYGPSSSIGYGVAADQLGRVFVTGHTGGAMDGTPLGSNDAFVSLFDAAGVRQWSRQFGSSEYDVGRSVATDEFGNAFIAGSTSGSLDGLPAQGQDAFVAKYDATGTRLWTRQLRTPGDDQAWGVATDGNGNVYVTGYTSGSLGGPSAGSTDSYIAKFDSSGNLLWTRQFGTSTIDRSHAVAADAAGNVYAVGWTLGALGGPHAGSNDVFVIKYDAAGNVGWIRQFGTPSSDVGMGISADQLGNIYVTGSTSGALVQPVRGSGDAFLAKLRADGQLVWTRQFGSDAYDIAYGVSADALGRVYVAGNTSGAFGGPHGGGAIDDGFAATFDASGVLLSAKQFSTDRDDQAFAVSADGNGNAYIAGMTAGSLDASQPNSPANVFVAKLATHPDVNEGDLLTIHEIAVFADSDGGEYDYTIDWGDGSDLTTGVVRRGEAFGEDLNTTNLSGAGAASRISHPRADAAHHAHVALATNGTATESFESLPAGPITIPRFLNLGGQTAVLSAGPSIRSQPTGTHNGAFPTSGDKFLFVDTGPVGPVFSIDFAQPQIGLGFYVTDAENPSSISVEFVLADGSTTIRRLLPTMASPVNGNNNDGSVAFYGLVDPHHPFIRFTVLRNQVTSDGFGIDDITLVLPGETGEPIANSILYATDINPSVLLRGVIGGAHTYADDGAYTATVTVTDPSGAATSRSFDVTVGNVAPTLALAGAAQVNEGAAFQLTIGNVVDPGADTVSQWRIDWNDGSPAQVFTSPPGTVAHVFADGPSTPTIQVTLVDEDGAHLVATHAVSVTNVAPTVNAGQDVVIDAGATVLRAGSFIDPGGDSWTGEVDYGDGAGFVPLAIAANKQFTLQLQYATPGFRTVRVRVTDDDGGVGTGSFAVTVRSAAPNLTLDPDLTLGWIHQFGTSANDEARAMAIDAAGNSYFAGYTQGDLVAANLGSNDVILGKIDPAGNRLWTIQFGTPEGDVARGVAVDADRNVFVSGDTIGSLGGQNVGETDAFLSKYTANGELVWARQLGTTALDVNRGLALDADGNAYIVGGTNGDLGGANLGGSDGYIAKYDNDGNLLWSKILGTTGDNDSFLSVAVDAQGNVYAGGVTNGSLDGPNAGLLDAFVARYDRDGNLIWVRQIGTSADEIGHNVRVDASGNVYTNGTTGGSLAGQNQGGTDYHVHKFDPQGTLLWARQHGTTAADQPRGFAVDAAGNAIVAGFTAGSLGRPNLGVNDLFLARYATAGEPQGILQFGTSASDLPWGAAVDDAGNVYLAAISQGSLAANHAGGWDVVFAKLSAIAIATESAPLVAVDLATFSDFDVGNYSYSIDWGDRTPVSTGIATIDVTDGQPNSLKLGSFDGLHTYADDGQYHVVVRLTDPTGRTSVRSFFATVANVSPTVALAGAAEVDEGDAFSLAIGAVVDPGPDTVTRWRVDWNDGSPVQEFSAPPGTIEHVFVDGPATRNVTVSLVDEDGVHVAGVHSVNVRNVAPTVDAGEDVVLDAGQSVIRSGSFTDPGSDTWTALVDYGDGGGFVPLPVSAENTFTLVLDYATPGVRTVQVRVADDDGGIGADSFLVTIVPTFLVTSLTPTPTGFVAAFNRPVDKTFVNLYDGPDADVEPADVTLVGNTVGPVAGSLVWNVAGNQLTFVKTGTPLAADTYTVTLFSRPFGFVDLERNLLDGDGDFAAGGDFVGGFSVASTAARTVGLPDFVRGPTQAVHVPNTSTGLPIRLSDGAGVLSLDLDVIYDPALLNISAIGRGANMPASWTVTVNLTQPGRARVTASGVAALAAGPVDVLRITATVPGTAPIGAAQVVRLDNVRANGGLIASIGDAALHKVAFLADVDGNFAYTAFDAAFISRVVVGFDTGFDAFPLVDPVIIGNSSSTGSLSGLDAAFVAQKAVFLPRPEIPDLPPNLPAPSPAAVDPAIGVPAAVFAQAGASAHVPVTVDNLDGLLGVTFRVNYETAPLDLTDEQVMLGHELEAAGWNLVQNVVDPAGVAYFAAFAAQPGTAGEATLLDLHFTSLASAVGTTTLNLSGPANDGGFAFTYIDGTLTLTTPGDVNLDGFVDLADLIALQQNFGKLADAVWTEGDLDGDGDVDRADLAIVASNFGRLPTPTTAASTQAPQALVTAAPRASTLVARRTAISARDADLAMADSLVGDATTSSRRVLTRRSAR